MLQECTKHFYYYEWERGCQFCEAERRVAENPNESPNIAELQSATPVALDVSTPNAEEWEWLRAIYPKVFVLECNRPDYQEVELDFWDSPLVCDEFRSLLLKVLHRSTWLPGPARFVRRRGVLEYVHLTLVRHP